MDLLSAVRDQAEVKSLTPSLDSYLQYRAALASKLSVIEPLVRFSQRSLSNHHRHCFKALNALVINGGDALLAISCFNGANRGAQSKY